MLIPLGILAGKNPIKATGGTITISGGYVYHTFKASGTFTPISTITNAEYLAIGGGGAGQFGFGGGGAGGYRVVTSQTFSSSFNIVIGAGGTGGTSSNGSNTSNGSGTIFAYGGGGGNWEPSTITQASGAGGNPFGTPDGFKLGQVNSGGFGNNGGQGWLGYPAGSPTFEGGGGGGGGAGSAGSSVVPSTKSCGNGGAGILNSTWASATGTGADGGYYAAGGGGSSPDINKGWSNGSGGIGGGGGTNNDGNGVVNTGSGASVTSAGNTGIGGSGLMIIRYAA